MKKLASVLMVLLLSSPAFTNRGKSHHHRHGPLHPSESAILSVSDFDGSGRVTHKDVKLARKAAMKGEYIAFFDRDANGELDFIDVKLAKRELGLKSTKFDRELARLHAKFGWLQNKSFEDASKYYGFRPIVSSLKGHGVHWMNDAGVSAVFPGGKATFDMIQGMNIPESGEEVWGLFWGQGAVPLFNDPEAESGLSTLDWPHGDRWKIERVQAFADKPPSFTSSEEETWHTHAGLCQVYDEEGNGIVHQLTSFAECQDYENAQPVEIGRDEEGNPVMGNGWVNLWMVHFWLYKINPEGIFGGLHPDLDPESIDEMETFDGREVPPFFMHHHAIGEKE